MTGVLSSFLMFTRSGVAVSNYAEMEAGARRAIDTFARDVRMASDESWNGNTSVTLTVPTDYTAAVDPSEKMYDDQGRVTYYYNQSAKAFMRRSGNGWSWSGSTKLCGNVESFQLSRYSRNNAPATSNADTKRIQLKMRLMTKAVSVVDQTSLVLSASYVMRNKPSN